MSKRFTDDAEMNVGLTDDEIVKALDVCYNSPCCTNECPYFNKNGRNFCVEDKAFYRDMKRIAQKLVEKDKKIEYYKDREKSFVNAVEKLTKEKSELKAEIERLTEENEHLDGCAKQFLADYQKCEIANTELQELNAKYYNEAKDLRRENAELQKQVRR